jgi:predicted transcriptional regulator
MQQLSLYFKCGRFQATGTKRTKKKNTAFKMIGGEDELQENIIIGVRKRKRKKREVRSMRKKW